MTTAPHPLVGELVDGRYRVQRHLADGGMATVLLAVDTRLDREVALKVMRPDLAADETFVSRFRREARSAARLSHPNVVPVHDQGEHEGRVFLAMEYVEGRTLRELVDTEGPLTPRAALDLLEAVLAGLATAHDAGYIHRDVKPENVLIPDRGPVKVADFGLARAVTSQTTTADDGVLFGTVAYLSPEQVERGIADARSDVYAAGLLLFELLTGTPAIEGESPIHIAFQHVHSGIPTPSSRVPGLPTALDGLVALATHRDPDERPRDAADYLRELDRVRADLTEEELDRRPHDTPEHRTKGAGAQTERHHRPSRTRAMTSPGGGADTPGGGPPSSRGRGRGRGAVAALLVALLVLAGGATWFFTAGPGGQVAVPEVAGQSRDAAEATLADHDLGLVTDRSFHESVPKGQAISADPTAGTDVSTGSDVEVVFSRGPERHDVPDLSGKTTKQATTALEDRHLTVEGTTREWSESTPKGQIVSTDPDAGTSLERGASVSLVVSRGPQPVDVPSVTGKPLESATSTLEKAGFEVERAEDTHSSSVPKGSVVSQSPANGTLTRGETVTLTVSKGPEMVTVPKVEGLSKSEATKKLEDAGFKVSVQTFLGGVLDEVRASRPGGGGTAEKGSTVTILVV